MKTDTTTRSDLDALTALNSDYIHSVQHSDVRRFDEILAEDFLCSNPDGSLVDKNQFLAQTARPVTMSRSFTRAPATPRQMVSSGMAAIPMSGRVGTESGSRYRRM
jgi:hypothetical protein